MEKLTFKEIIEPFEHQVADRCLSVFFYFNKLYSLVFVYTLSHNTSASLPCFKSSSIPYGRKPNGLQRPKHNKKQRETQLLMDFLIKAVLLSLFLVWITALTILIDQLLL